MNGWSRGRALGSVGAIGAALAWMLIVVGPVGARPSAAAANRCPARAPQPQPSGPSVTTETVQKAGSGRPEILMARYPRPDGPGRPWSQWGQGLVLPNGRYLSAMGDERGVGGNSYLFAYDPAQQRLTRFADVLSHVDHGSGDFGYGKIHGQIVPGRCGDAYFATYWGTRDGLKYTSTYRGDVLFRIDPATSKLVPLGPPVVHHGIPSLAGLGKDGLVYGEAVDPAPPHPRNHDQGAFFVYDTKTRRMVFRSDDPNHSLFRNVLLDGRGRAYVAAEGGHLLRYTPGAAKLEQVDARLPGGGSLRASTRAAPDGTVYGVTKDPNELFALERDGSIRSLGQARGYTTSLALEPDGSRFYYVPGADGDAWKQGAPIIAVDTKSGEQRVVAELNDLAEQHLGLTLAGSYNVALDGKRHRLYIGLNAGATHEHPWGEVVLAVVNLRS